VLVGLEMDEQRMSPTFIAALGSGAAIAGLAARIAGGLLLGGLFFLGLWRSARNLLEGGSVLATSALTIGRFVGLGALLFLASLRGAGPLLETTIGVMIARFLILRRLHEAAS